MKVKLKLKRVLKKVTYVMLSLVMVFTTLQMNVKDAIAVSLNNEATALCSQSWLTIDMSNTLLNGTAHINTIQLDGTTAFCLDPGLRLSTGYRYARTQTIINSDYNRVWNYFVYDGGGWNNTTISYAQPIFWCLAKGIPTSHVSAYAAVMQKTYEAKFGNSGVGTGGTGAIDFQSIAKKALTYANVAGTLYIYTYGTSSVQRLITTEPGTPPSFHTYSVERTGQYTANNSVSVQLTKTDSETGTKLEGVTIDFYRDNVKGGSATTNASGVAAYTFSDSVTKTDTVKKYYMTGYDHLSLPNQQKVNAAYPNYYHSKSAAENAATAEAEKLAQQSAEEAADKISHTYKCVETGSRTGYYLDPSKTTVIKNLTGSGTVSMSLTNVLQKGNVTIIKKDSQTNQSVAGAVYGIYANGNITHPDGKTGTLYTGGELVKTMPKTDANGQSTVTGLPLGNYYVQEIAATKNYLKDPNRYYFSLTYAGQNQSVTTANVTVNEDRQPGKITIVKTDADTNHVLKDAVFQLYAKNDILYPDGKSGVKYHAGDLIATFPATDAHGQTSLDNLYLGDYYVKEVTAPHLYVLDASAKNISLTYAGQDVQVSVVTKTITNDHATGKITITKCDSETDQSVPGGIYKLYAAQNIYHPDGKTGLLYAKDALIAAFPATDNYGQSLIDDLYMGQYYILESKAPDGYVLSHERYDVSIEYAGQNVPVVLRSQKVTDHVQRGTISFVKEDKELYNRTADASITDANRDRAQGDATRAGATYGLYARNDIVHKDTKTGVIQYNSEAGNINELILSKGTDLNVMARKAAAGTLLATAKTDVNGEIQFDHLYLGDYYIKEIEPSEGYLLDKTEYDVSLTYAGQNVEVTSKETTVFETVKKQAFDVLKVGHVPGTSTNAVPLKGVEFTVKLESDVVRLGWDDAPTYDVIVTDAYGEGSSIELPYGTYHVKETKPAADYAVAEDFYVTVLEDSRVHQSYSNNIIIDEQFTALIKAVKKDRETGKTVLLENAEFKIKALSDVYVDGKKFSAGEYIGYWNWNVFDGFYTDSWKTNKEGYVIIDRKLGAGDYQLEEIHAPQGYVVDSSPVTFKVTNQNMYDTATDGSPVIVAYKADQPVKGQITVEKRGEVLVGYNEATHSFIYEQRGLANATFDIIAKEDIMDPSNDGTVLYAKGEVVETLTTGSNGKAVSSKLPLGKYRVCETEAPHGYIINSHDQDVTLSYADEVTPVIFGEASFVNVREKYEVSAVKLDSETDQRVLGAQFTLYAKQDIKNADGKVIVSKDQAVSTAASDKNGQAKFHTDLPVDYEWYIKETKAPIGYASTDQVFEFSTAYKDQHTPVVTFTSTFKNQPITVEISKQDITTGVEVEGNKLYVLDKDGKKIDSWISKQDESHVIKYLHTGETYTLVEELAASGYLKANNVTFTIKDTGDVQRVEMKDDLVKGQITVSKDGEKLTGINQDEDGNIQFVYENKPVAGAKFEVYASEDIVHPDHESEAFYRKGDLVATLTTDDNGQAVLKDLPLGTYRIKEIAAGNGFVLNTEEQTVTLSYKDQLTAIVFDKADYTNTRQKADISVIKQDAEDKTPLSGAVFGLYAKEDIYSYDQNLLVKKGTLIETAQSDDSGQAHFKADLPLSVYEVKEIQAPIGYSSTAEVFEADASYQGQDVETVQLTHTFENKITKMKISKKDITNHEEIAGAHLTVFEKDDPASVFDTWISGTDGKDDNGHYLPHMIKGLEPGKTYILKETSSPYGYAIANEIAFTVLDTGQVQSIEMKDEMVFGQLSWKKTGEIFNQVLTSATEFGVTQSPVWNHSGILGANITIYAAEDIVIGNHTYYRADEEIETLESDWDEVLSSKLPAGRYYYVETKTPHGYLVNTDKHYFEVEDSQKNELQIIENELINDRPQVDIDMTKILEEQKIFVNKDAYKDVVFGIFAREDIYDYMGNVAIENGTLIYTSGINEDGTLTLADTFDLPNGVYYLQELSTNSQYVFNDKQYDFEIAYHGEDVARYTVHIGSDGIIENELARGTIKVQKADTLDEKKKLEGIEFHISANKDMSDVIRSVKTDKDGVATFGELELGTYYIQEAKQVDGYVFNDHIYTVEVTNDGDVLTVDVDNQPTEMIFSKVDETGTQELPGATIQIIDKETEEVVDEWISTDEAHHVHYLVEGKEYIMREITAPYGYEMAEDIVFVAGDGKTVTMKDELILTDILVHKVDSQTKQAIKSLDFEFTMYSDPKCTKALLTVHANTKDGTALFKDLPYGTVYIRETKAPKGYQLSHEVKKIVIDEHLEGAGDVYSFEYLNTPLPSIIKSGDDTSLMTLSGLGLVAILGIMMVSKKERRDDK